MRWLYRVVITLTLLSTLLTVQPWIAGRRNADILTVHASGITSGDSVNPYEPSMFILKEDFILSGAVAFGGSFGGTTTPRFKEFNGSSGSLSGVDSTVGHPGILTTNPGTTSGRGVIIYYDYFGNVGAFNMAGSTFSSYWIWAFDASITNQGAYAGFLSSGDISGGTLNNGCWVRRLATDTNFQCVCISGGTATTTDYGSPPVADRYYRAVVNSTTAGTIKFRVYEDGVVLGSEISISTNVPTGALVPMFLHISNGNSVTVKVDAFGIKQTGITTR